MNDLRELIDTTTKELDAIYDCTKFVDIRNRMLCLIGELKACEESASDWYLLLKFQLETLRSFLEAWTANTAELSIDCQSLAREFKAKL